MLDLLLLTGDGGINYGSGASWFAFSFSRVCGVMVGLFPGGVFVGVSIVE